MSQYIEREKIGLTEFERIESIPAVRGKWLVHGYSAPCSNCGFDTGFGNTPFERLLKQFKFCPNCGAEMR